MIGQNDVDVTVVDRLNTSLGWILRWLIQSLDNVFVYIDVQLGCFVFCALLNLLVWSSYKYLWYFLNVSRSESDCSLCTFLKN